MPAELFTIGHSTHTMAHFVGLLKQHGVTVVCDVRSRPYSRYNPQYNRETLSDEMKHHGIAYIFLGKALGARSENPDCYVNGKIQYAKLADAPLFQHGLNRLQQGARNYAIALMCAEKDPVTCHRMILVVRALRSTFAIKHILEDGRIESNAAAETRLMNVLGIHPDILRNENHCIEQAYDLQGKKIAYVRTA